jgi:GMP synthase (glutamine-hydrolysing)
VWHRGERYPVWMSHGDRVTQLPDGFSTYAISANAPFAVWPTRAAAFYGVQFPPRGGPHAAWRAAHPQLRARHRRLLRRLDHEGFRDEAIVRIRRRSARAG